MATMARSVPPLSSEAPSLGDGRYVLVSRIGEGGMAAVYRCFDRKLRVWRAVKVLLPEHARRSTIRERFEREAHTMAPLEHPNLVRVYDVGQVAGLPFLVMELVDGGTLADWTARYGAMPPRLAVHVALQIVRALTAVHAHGVVHRDVKPKNVLVAPSGACKLTDFGIAQIETDGRTRPGAVLGTLEYMAPEQRIDARNVDARSDLYGVGATLWHLLRAEDRADLFFVATNEALAARVPEGLRPVLLRCVAYDREARIGSATELASAFEGVLRGLPADPPDTPPLWIDLSALEVPLTPGEQGELEGLLQNASPRPKPLPYYMPTSDPRRNEVDDEPAWVDRSATPAQITLALDGPELSAVETLAVDPTPVPPEVERPFGWAPWLVLLLPIVATPVLGVLVGVLVVGSSVASLSEARTEAMESRTHLYRVLETEQPLVDELAGTGADRGPLEQSYLGFVEERQEPARLAAATAFVDLVVAEGRQRVDPRSSGIWDVQITRRLARIQEARQACVGSHARWQEAADGPLARVALAVGIVEPDLD